MRFPTTLAPVIGSKSVIVQSADNAHSTSVDMRAWCGSDGNWRMIMRSDFTQQLSVPQCGNVHATVDTVFHPAMVGRYVMVGQ